MDYQSQRQRLQRELQFFRSELKSARNDFESQRLESIIRGTEMMLQALPTSAQFTAPSNSDPRARFLPPRS